MNDLKLPLSKLGVEHSVSFIVAEFFERYLSKRKDSIQEWANEDTKTLYTYAKSAVEYAKFAFTDTLTAYLDKTAELLEASENEREKVTEAFTNALADNHLYSWYRELKT